MEFGAYQYLLAQLPRQEVPIESVFAQHLGVQSPFHCMILRESTLLYMVCT